MSTAWARRALLVLGLVCAVLVTAPGTASASFTGRVVVSSAVGTITVAEPTGPTTTGSTACAQNTTNYTVTVSWTRSPTARVVGYRVTETVNGTARPVQTVSGTTVSRSATKTRSTTATHSFSIVATTDYGWTSPVAATVGYTC